MFELVFEFDCKVEAIAFGTSFLTATREMMSPFDLPLLTLSPKKDNIDCFRALDYRQVKGVLTSEGV